MTRHQLSNNHHVAASVVVAAILALGASFGVAWAAGMRTVVHTLVHPSWQWLAAAVVGQVFAYLGYTLAYREIVRAEGGTELDVPKVAALVATGFGVFVHAGGFALDRAALERAGLSRREARARVLGLGFLEYLVLAPAAAVAAALVLLWREGVDTTLTLPWLIGVPVGAVMAGVAVWQRRRLDRSRGGWRMHVRDALDALVLVLCLARWPFTYGLAVVGMALYWLGDMFTLWAALHAFSAQSPPVSHLVLGYATGYALTRRTLPLGGAGVVEALLPFALGWVAIGLAPALAAVLAYRTLNLWLPMIPALAGLPTLRALERRRPARGRTPLRGSID